MAVRAEEPAAGKFLVAARGLPDPNFAETVVLLTSYSSKGAMGVIINRPTRVSVDSLFPGNKATKHRAEKAFWGGPVEGDAVLALTRTQNPIGARLVMGDVYLISTKQSLEKALETPGAVRLYMGYAGWGAGQLEREMKIRSWHVLRMDPAFVFDTEPDAIWPKLIQRTDVFLAEGARYDRRLPPHGRNQGHAANFDSDRQPQSR